MPLAVEEQSLMVAQALECLQLYWFGVGDAYSGNLCLGKPYVTHPSPLSVDVQTTKDPYERKFMFMLF